MGDKKIYIVAKIFDQAGCLAYLCKTVNEARCLPGTLEALRARLQGDIDRGLRQPDVLARSLARLPLYAALDTRKLDTTRLTPAGTARAIAAL